MRHAHDGGAGDLRMLSEALLHLARVHVEPAADVHLAAPSGEVQVVRGVEMPEIAGVHPAAGVDGGRGGVGVAPVFAHRCG